MLIKHQDIKVNPTKKASFQSPIPGSVNDGMPVSANVHLYADPSTIMTDVPVLYADCEGLEGGESSPKADTVKLQDRALGMRSPRRSPSLTNHNRHERHIKRSCGVSRQLAWAIGDKIKSKREYAVTELYPRLLYTFSDVVVFVLRNSK